MNSSRLSFVFLLLSLLAAASVVGAAPAVADEEPLEQTAPEIVFPIVGETEFVDSFGAPRSGGRSHEGSDIMTDGVKGLPVVAAAAGTVKWVDEECCHLAIDHGDAWSTWYIHLNNDTPGTDDGQGRGIAPGIEEGTDVKRGQLIGWVGDSGNAEWVAPQLHFEMRKSGTAVNPYTALMEAPVLEAAASNYAGEFRDDEGAVHQENIDQLARLGITRGCNPPTNDRYCPQRLITRGEMAAFLRRYLDLPAAKDDHYRDDTDSIFQGDANAVTEAGIGFGCTATDYCPDEPLLREEMAQLLVRTYARAEPDRYTNTDGVDYFTDDQTSAYHESINRLKAAAVTVGCNPPDNDRFCPERPLTRAEMATFIARALNN